MAFIVYVHHHFRGCGKVPPMKVMQKLAASADFANWDEARKIVEEVAEALSQFTHLAQQQGISKATVSAVNKTLQSAQAGKCSAFSKTTREVNNETRSKRSLPLW